MEFKSIGSNDWDAISGTSIQVNNVLVRKYKIRNISKISHAPNRVKKQLLYIKLI